METDDSRNFPLVIRILPDDDESSRFTRGNLLLGFILKFVKTNFNGSVIFDRIDFDTPGYQFPGDLPADISFGSFDNILFGSG